MEGRLFLVFLHYLALCSSRFTDDNTFYWRKSHDSKCEPFSAFLVACNQCVCSADGVSYCTKMDCKDQETRESDEIQFASEMAKRRIEAERSLF